MKRIVVGVDRSYAARVVSAWTNALAAAAGAEVVEVHAFVAPRGANDEEAARLLALREADLAARCLEEAAAGDVSARLVVRAGDPRQLIGRLGDELEGDLIVLGRSGEGADAEESHVGTVAEHAAHHWAGSLAVVPTLHAGPVTRIVLALDGSPDSLAAVDWCASLAPDLDAGVVAVAVPDSSAGSAGRATASLREWTAPLARAGVDLELVVSEDQRPIDALMLALAAHQGDLLVLGRRGTGGFHGLPSGGVALAALRRAPVPVALISADGPAPAP